MYADDINAFVTWGGDLRNSASRWQTAVTPPPQISQVTQRKRQKFEIPHKERVNANFTSVFVLLVGDVRP